MPKALKRYTGITTGETQSMVMRRALVALELGDSSESVSRRRRKSAISLPNMANNVQRAEEVAKTFNIDKDSLCLEVNGGFELRSQDSIMSISEDEVVTARIIASDGLSE
ncbi:hypothetical protein GYMLUDRAFT_77786 [Collybiopsis luxurians FD-317 M1]|uniref:Uncharacterized protein n=1 Tax=Collybiopsis luxurians FD-317 M1 TaxID=944289 RepID=A0A0D0BDA7_9AGAR|nr:hypothetical protein GYMLUDRAFT_77786 [Collybiopsis luxurians FD-317 M1]